MQDIEFTRNGVQQLYAAPVKINNLVHEGDKVNTGKNDMFEFVWITLLWFFFLCLKQNYAVPSKCRLETYLNIIWKDNLLLWNDLL